MIHSVLNLLGVLFSRFLDSVSLCSPGHTGTHQVDQAGLKLMTINLPQPPVG